MSTIGIADFLFFTATLFISFILTSFRVKDQPDCVSGCTAQNCSINASLIISTNDEVAFLVIQRRPNNKSKSKK